jgi:hypothetical protein
MKYKLYNVLTNVLYKEYVLYIEEIIGDYRCGSGRVYAIIGQLIDLRLVYEFRSDLQSKNVIQWSSRYSFV